MVYCYGEIIEAGKTIERCKDKGWEGAKFKDTLSTKMICSDFTQSELDASRS